MDERRELCRVIAGLIVVSVSAAPRQAAGGEFAWQQEYARRSPAGDIQWAPRASEFKAGDVVRHIDFEQGDDSGSGSRSEPWKHHPWDVAAVGAAAAASGVDTYVFKGGVVYRGVLRSGNRGGPGVRFD